MFSSRNPRYYSCSNDKNASQCIGEYRNPISTQAASSSLHQGFLFLIVVVSTPADEWSPLRCFYNATSSTLVVEFGMIASFQAIVVDEIEHEDVA